MNRLTSSTCILLISAFLAPALAQGQERSADDEFESVIRPLLIKRCHSCHGPEKTKGGLNLTSREAILAGGDSGPAAEPGKPEESLLIDAIHYDLEPRMPPKAKLPDSEIAALERWIKLGLPWPGSNSPPTGQGTRPAPGAAASENHWAFQPVRNDVSPPTVQHEDWVRTPIDRFILARLEAEALSPSPPADRRTLIRRLSYDLTGLPPSPQDVDSFVHDPAPEAYERLVDRLLASPLYGEQWARHWLDIARYSDTKGYVYAREEGDWVHAWVYRDWVVRALNEDMPYDRFLLLQLAAEQVSDDPADLAAMGFLTLGRRFLGVTHDIIDDRIDVVTRGMLGLTVACARCHDHKFDPIPTSDYYALYGVFRNGSEQLVPAGNFQDRLDGTDAFAVGLRERQTALHDRMTRERAAAANRIRARITDYLLAQFELEKYPEEGFDQVFAESDIIPAFVRRWRDTLKRASEHDDPIFFAWHAFATIPPSDFATQAAAVARQIANQPPGTRNPLVARAFANPPANPREVAKRYGALFRDVIDRWEKQREQARKSESSAPHSMSDPADEAIRQFLYSPNSPCEVPDEPIVNVEGYFPTSTIDALWKLQGEVDRWLIRSQDAPPYALILSDRDTSVETRVLRRGNPANLGDVAPRHFLRVLAGPNPPPFQHGSGRLELARAIVDPQNPLTARVLVNRVWMHHFGAGLVSTPGDLGTRATPPSHPNLLDWLAHRFVSEGWSLKKLHRQILLSATYQQSSAGPLDPARLEKAQRLDPENRWLWRMPIHRLSFEELRDSLLATSGELDPSSGGRPVKLFQEPFATRRTLYGLVDREDLPSVFRVFDFANPDLLIAQRNETAIPQQALFFLNHPFLLQQARALVKRDEVTTATDPAEKVRTLYRLAFQREPTALQSKAALQLIEAAQAETSAEPSLTAPDWQYGYGRFEPDSGKVADFHPLPHNTGEALQGGPSWPDATLGWVQLTAEGGHPGNDLAHAAVRRWVAPHDATIQIRSRLVHEVAAGDGVRAYLSSSRQGLLHTAEVHHSEARVDLDALDVKAGDTVDFVVDIRDNLNSDQFLWAPVLVETTNENPKTWDARVDFNGIPAPSLDPWEQLAQVLLMANEFTFIE